MTQHNSGHSGVLSKIRKMLELSNANSNPHEAALAAERAQDLMAKYNLSLLDVQGYDPRDPGNYIQEIWDLNSSEVTPEPAITGTLFNWRRTLVYALSRTHYCDAIQFGRGKKVGDGLASLRMAVIGEEHNIQMVRYLYRYLCEQIIAMEYRHWLAYRGKDKRMVFRDGFLRGAVRIVYSRLWKAMQEEEERQRQAVGTGTALAVVKGKALEEALDLFQPGRYKIPSPSPTSYTAFAIGYEAGKDLNLNRPLEGSEFFRMLEESNG